MKKHVKHRALAGTLSLLLCLSLSACSEGPGTATPDTTPSATPSAAPTLPVANTYTPGVYEGEAGGHNAKVGVKVTFSESAITTVEVLDNIETAGIKEAPTKQIPAKIVEGQTLAVDVCTGATFTSRAILAAGKDCVVQAGGNPDALAPAAEKPAPTTAQQKTDVLVVGAGLAGLSAAIAARDAGAEVILLEKLSYPGGNTSLSTGVFNLGDTDLQKSNQVEDSPEKFAKLLFDVALKNGGERDPVLVELVTGHSNSVYNWLVDHGVEFAPEVFPVIGSDTLRGHQALPNAPGLMFDLEAAALAAGVQILYETPATALLVDDAQAVTGVTATNKNGDALAFSADKVILCSGGFGRNPEMMEQYWGLTELTAVDSPGLTGEMLENAIALGAATRDMQIPGASAPTISADGRTLISSLVLSNGAILVDDTGSRYTNESASYGEIGQATMSKYGGGVIHEIFDQNTRDNFYKIEDYVSYGLVVEADTLAELAEKIGVPAAELEATVDTYNKASNGEVEDPYGRTIFKEGLTKAPYYCIDIRSGGVVITPGGLQIDLFSRVVKADGTPIQNLYGAGEILGGYQGAGYSGGDSLAMASITGKIAGEHAVENLSK